MKLVRRYPIRVASAVAVVVTSLGGAGFIIRGVGNATGAAEPAARHVTRWHHSAPPSLAAGKSSATLSVSCLAPHKAGRGRTVLVNYTIESSIQSTVGLGVSLRVPGQKQDVKGLDREVIARPISYGENPAQREFTFPAALDPGTYEVRIEIFPNDDDGQAETLADAPCGTVIVT
jgi:hypothetical protein